MRILWSWASILVVAGWGLSVMEVHGQPTMGTAFTYQGRLIDNGTPADGVYDLEFSLYSEAGLLVAGPVQRAGQQVTNGLFTATVDFGSNVFDGNACLLEIGVRRTGSGSFSPLTPRQPITAMPYALFALNPLNSVWSLAGSDVYYNSGNVGIGTSTPTQALDVAGDMRVRGGQGFTMPDAVARVFLGDPNHSIRAVYGSGVRIGTWQAEDGIVLQQTTGRVGIGMPTPGAKLHVGGTPGVDGIMFPDGSLQTTASSDENLTLPYTGTTPVSGTAFSITSTQGAAAISGLATKTGPGIGQGGYFQCDLDSGRGVTGGSTGISGRGVSGLATGENGYGVHGETTHVSGSNSAAVIGESVQGRGVVGITETSNEWVPAVYGRNNGTGDGLYGWSGHRHGAVGVSYSSNANHAGVWALNNGAGPGLLAKGGTGGRAAVFEGNVLIRTAGGAPLVELGEGLDYAEGFDVSDSTSPEPGTVLVIDGQTAGRLTISRRAYDHKVAGIVAGANGLRSAVRLGVGQFDCDVALAGRVYCNVDTNYGSIKPGDLLTTSPTAGHAMTVKDHARAQGAILGKAMESMASGRRGQILVLVTLQ